MNPVFPWFGGKRKVAPQVWAALGNPGHYIEPFAGSLGVLLGRPEVGKYETVNDLDCLVANFYRAVKADWQGVARYADHPIHQVEYQARNDWMFKIGAPGLCTAMRADPDHYDVKVAGYWVWGVSCSISSATFATRVTRSRPMIANKAGINSEGGDVYLKLSALAERLRDVDVLSGDWSKAVSGGLLARPWQGTVGVFLDPPYSTDLRAKGLYRVDDGDVAHAVREWCIEHQDRPRTRIVLAGMPGEHALPGWRELHWETTGQHSKGGESLWLSPQCT